MNNDKKKSLESVVYDAEALYNYLIDKGRNHNHYKYYSRFNVIYSIINDRCLYLTKGDNWNDLYDRLAFSDSAEGFVRFGTCFSFSTSENVAMWMLYGGVNRDGAMLDFTRKDANHILSLDVFELGYRDEEWDFSMVQSISAGCRVFFEDILYCGEGDNGVSVKRSDERVDGLSTVPERDGMLKKSYPWAYENEVRLVLEVPEDEIGVNIECARLPLSRSSDELRGLAFLAPNSTLRGTGFNGSRLRGKMEWNICHGCSYESRRKTP